MRYGLLILLVMVFSASAVVNGLRHVSDMRQLITLQKTGAWAISELDRSVRDFTYQLELAGGGQRDHSQLMLSYDLLWSRLQMIQVGDDTREVRDMPTATEVILALELAMRAHESAVLTLRPGDQRTANTVLQSFVPVREAVHRLSVDVFNRQSAPARQVVIAGMAPPFALSLLGLLISGIALLLLFLREGMRRKRQALEDELTGIPNRRHFAQLLQQVGARSQRDGARVALLLVDINEFKAINDSIGHHLGDSLLQHIAERLRAAVRQGEVIARVGGDEFAVIQEGLGSFEEASMLARRIIEFLTRPVMLDGHEIFVSISMGVSFYPDDGEDISRVLACAGTAMVLAKQDAGNSYRLFEAEMNAAAQRRKQLSEDLRGAISASELMLYFQPVVNLRNGRVTGVEALLRWHHPELGFIPPPEIVSIAEQYGLAQGLNEWVLREACRQNRCWQLEGLAPMRVWVNISPAMYTQHDLVASVVQALAESGLDAQWLGIEVTEDTTMRDIETSPGILRDLQELGILLALDDFGTGYSSLSHLKRLPISRLKIDRSFVNDLNNEPCDMRFVQTLLSLAKQLDMEVVAEGIENQRQLRALISERCACGQGYLFARPLPAAELEQLLRDGSIGKPLQLCVSLPDDSTMDADSPSSGSEDEPSYHSQPGTARH
nr:EAL domain-containing protein [Motiliproteus sediminis]